MKRTKSVQLKQMSLAVIAVALLIGFGAVEDGKLGFVPLVSAAEDGHSSGGHSGGSGGHGSSGHSSGHDEDEHSVGHTPGPKGGGGHGSKKGGHGSSDIAHGGGKSVEGKIFNSRRPVWAQEGIPEVELGRLNVSRAPTHVLNRAEAEALATYSPAMLDLYNLTADQAAELLIAQFRDITRYDSPLQNLALYKDLLTFGQSQLPGVDPASQMDLAAIFLGSASDKTLPISEDSVTALNRILGLVELSDDDRNTLATKADTVRAAILTGHGDVDIEH